MGRERYTNIFRAALENGNRMCLCGIMAAEREDLPAAVRVEVDRFTDANVRWLIEVLLLANPELERSALKPRALAIFAAIEGAQLVARGRGDVVVFDETIKAYQATGLLP